MASIFRSERIQHFAVMGISGHHRRRKFCLLLALWMLWPGSAPAWASGQSQAPVSVVTGGSAPQLEQFAARELCGYLEKLFGLKATPVRQWIESSRITFLVGNPSTNSAIPRTAFPEVSDQGIVLRSVTSGGRPALIVGGGSPRATLWAVYELAERWGVRYLVRGDVLPAKKELDFAELDVVMEPILRVRAHPTIQDFASSGESWAAADFFRLIDQLAKLKFSRINFYAYGWQPYLHYELKGIQRKSAWLWYDYHYPITPDMPGRELFGDATEFWNPDLPLNSSYERFIEAGLKLGRALVLHAKSRGMEVAVSAPTTDFTPEFAPLLKGAERSGIRSGLTIVPGAETPLDDPQLAELALTTLKATIDTYPEADYVTVWMPEVRQWTGEYERAWKALDAKHGISRIRSLEQIFAAAARRRGSEVGRERVMNEIKGDIASLYFYERLLKDSRVLETTRRPDMKFMYWGVSEELFPIIERILPAGWEIGVMPSNQPVRLLRRIEVLKELPAQNPGVLDLTIDDDNLGMVPQLTPKWLSRIVQVLKRNRWAGFTARERFPFDHDWPLAYLSRAAWHEDVRPDDVARDQLTAVCGPECAEEMLDGFHEIEWVTTLLADANRNFSKERPGTLMKYWRPGPVPTYLAAVRSGYERALNAVRRARVKSTPAGRTYLDFWQGRFEFAVGYTDTVRNVHQAGAAEMVNDYSSALKHAQEGLGSLRRGLEAYARIARSQTDRGAIAMLGEFAYRPLKAKIAELTRLVEDGQ